jgi:phage terminase large subunit-like protein
MTAGVEGVQTPTFEVVPPIADRQTAEDAIELALAADVRLLPWQTEQVHRLLGLRADGEWAATRCGLAVPRQSGKGVILEVVVLAKTVLLGERVLWTAHEVRTMQEAFQRFRAVLDATPALSALVKSVRTANGQERIQFTNGAEVKFTARSKSAVRGLGFRTIIADEAQELDYLTMGAMMPTLSGQGAERTQLILTGTPPYSAKGEFFTDMRASAYTGGDDRLVWSEWSAAREEALTDRAVWAKTNPSLGTVIREDKIVDELNALQARPDVFRRERLGEWGRSGDRSLAIDEAQWAAGRLLEASWPKRDEAYSFQHGDTRVIGVDCTFSAEMTTLSEVVPLEGNRVGIRILDAGPGLEWVAGSLAAVRQETAHILVVFDPARTGDLSADLREAGIRNAERRRRVELASGRDLTLACEALVRQVREGRAVHDDPRLDAAASAATRSTFDDGKGWKLVGIEGADVSPLIAAALALRALRGVPARRGPGQRIVY